MSALTALPWASSASATASRKSGPDRPEAGLSMCCVSWEKSGGVEFGVAVACGVAPWWARRRRVVAEEAFEGLAGMRIQGLDAAALGEEGRDVAGDVVGREAVAEAGEGGCGL